MDSDVRKAVTLDSCKGRANDLGLELDMDMDNEAFLVKGTGYNTDKRWQSVGNLHAFLIGVKFGINSTQMVHTNTEDSTKYRYRCERVNTLEGDEFYRVIRRVGSWENTSTEYIVEYPQCLWTKSRSKALKLYSSQTAHDMCSALIEKACNGEAP